MITASTLFDDRMVTFLAGLGLLALFFWYFATDFERKKRNIGTIIVVLIGIFSFLSIVPTKNWGDVLKGDKPLSEAHTLKGGIDLIGGSSFTLRVQPGLDKDGNPVPVTPTAVQQAIETVEKRLNAHGTADLLIVAQGEDRILVQMPGVSPQDAAEVRIILEKVARLELKTVHPENRLRVAEYLQDPENSIVPGYEHKKLEDEDEDGKKIVEDLLINKRYALDGSSVIHAQELYGPHEGKLTVELNLEGAEKMFQETGKIRHGIDRIAIVLNGKVLSAPTVQSRLGAKFEISGMHDVHEARQIARALVNPINKSLTVKSINPPLAK